MENRYRMLSDDKQRGEHEARLRLDRGCDEIAEARRALEELKFLIAEKTKIGCNLMDELQRAKRCVDDKTYDASRLKEEVCAKHDMVVNDQQALGGLMNEIDSCKVQRAEMWREIQRHKEILDKKCQQSNMMADKMAHVSADIHRVDARIEDFSRMIERLTHDINCKKHQLDEKEKELAHTRMQS